MLMIGSVSVMMLIMLRQVLGEVVKIMSTYYPKELVQLIGGRHSMTSKGEKLCSIFKA
jgi:hypothetical protein